MEGQLGDVVSPFAIDKLTMATGQKLLGGILSKKIRIVKIHFRKGMGYLHCFEGECCEVIGIPGVRYVFPFIVYPSDLEGGLLKPVNELVIDDLVLKSLVLGKEAYENIITKDKLQANMGSDITKVDLLVSCTDSEYQKKQFDIAGNAIWRKVLNKEAYKGILTLFHTKAEEALGRFHDSQTFAKAMLDATATLPSLDRPSADSKEVAVKSQVIEEDIDFEDMFDGDETVTVDAEPDAQGGVTEKQEYQIDDDDIPF